MKYFLYNDGSTLTMSSSKVPSSTMITYLSVSACRYAPGMSKNSISLFKYYAMSAVRNTASVKTVGDVSPSLLMYVRFLLPFAQAIPFTLPSRFSFRNTKEAIALVCSYFIIFLGPWVRKFSYHGAVKSHQWQFLTPWWKISSGLLLGCTVP